MGQGPRSRIRRSGCEGGFKIWRFQCVAAASCRFGMENQPTITREHRTASGMILTVLPVARMLIKSCA